MERERVRTWLARWFDEKKGGGGWTRNCARVYMERGRGKEAEAEAEAEATAEAEEDIKTASSEAPQSTWSKCALEST
jgi:hypothetical protein